MAPGHHFYDVTLLLGPLGEAELGRVHGPPGGPLWSHRCLGSLARAAARMGRRGLAACPGGPPATPSVAPHHGQCQHVLRVILLLHLEGERARLPGELAAWEKAWVCLSARLGVKGGVPSPHRSHVQPWPASCPNSRNSWPWVGFTGLQQGSRRSRGRSWAPSPPRTARQPRAPPTTRRQPHSRPSSPPRAAQHRPPPPLLPGTEEETVHSDWGRNAKRPDSPGPASTLLT